MKDKRSSGVILIITFLGIAICFVSALTFSRFYIPLDSKSALTDIARNVVRVEAGQVWEWDSKPENDNPFEPDDSLDIVILEVRGDYALYNWVWSENSGLVTEPKSGKISEVIKFRRLKKGGAK